MKKGESEPAYSGVEQRSMDGKTQKSFTHRVKRKKAKTEESE